MVGLGALGAVAFRAAVRPEPGRETTPSAETAGPALADRAATRREATVEAGASALHDRSARDELRRKILAAWASEGATAPAAPGKREPMPQRADGALDPAYIQSVVRAELIPLAGKCYEELLVRAPKAGGRLVLSYTILGGAELGGVVDDVEVETAPDGGLADDRLTTCMRESMASVAFRPPPGDGHVTVSYPIELWPDDPDEKR